MVKEIIFQEEMASIAALIRCSLYFITGEKGIISWRISLFMLAEFILSHIVVFSINERGGRRAENNGWMLAGQDDRPNEILARSYLVSDRSNIK